MNYTNFFILLLCSYINSTYALPTYESTILKAQDKLDSLAAYGVIKKIDLSGPDGINNENAYGETVLHIAAQHPELFSPSLIEDLIYAGANVTEVDTSGDTPLHFASYHNYLPAMELFIEHGDKSMLSERNADGYTALDEAIEGIIGRSPKDYSYYQTAKEFPITGKINKPKGYDAVSLLLENGACVSP